MAQATFAQSCEIIKIIQNEFVSNQTIAEMDTCYMFYGETVWAERNYTYLSPSRSTFRGPAPT